MKKQVILLATSLVLIVILAQIGFFNSLLLFILVGAIPGTTYSLPSSAMLLGTITVMWFLLFRYATLKTLHRRTTRNLAKTSQQRKKRMPVRRFNQI